MAKLGYSIGTAKQVIANLRTHGWIDRRTRAILLQFSIYNPNTGYISIGTYHFEILPTGYGNPFPMIDTLLLTSTQTGFYQFYLICQLLFIIMVVLFVLKEVYKIYRKKCAYFRDGWNWVEMLQITSSFFVVVFYVIKSKMVLNSAVKVKENPFVPVSFGKAISWNQAENAVLSIALFIATVKLLRMIRFNPHISIMLSSFRASRGLLLSYSVIFAIIFLSYAQLGRLAFGSDMLRYSSFQRVLYSELLMCLGGKMDLPELTRANRVLGPVFGFSFIMLMSFIFVNFFVAILNDSYEDVKDNTDKQSKEFEMADFILERLSELLGFRKRSRQDDDASIGDPELLEQQRTEDSESREKASFSTLAVNSHRLRRIARGKQLQKAKLRIKNKKERKLKAVRFEEQKLAAPDSSKTRLQQVKRVMSSVLAFDSSPREQRFKRMDVLTEKLARDEVRQDIELLCIIRLLSNRNDTQHSLSPASSHTIDEIEIASLITASSLSITEQSSESGDCSDNETLELLRSRASFRPLPQHLRGREFQEQLRSTLTAKKTYKVAKRKAPDHTIFKYYSFY